MALLDQLVYLRKAKLERKESSELNNQVHIHIQVLRGAESLLYKLTFGGGNFVPEKIQSLDEEERGLLP